MKILLTKYFFSIIFILSFFSFSCKEKKAPPPQTATPPPVVDVMIAKSQTVSSTIEANGNVIANDYVELHPQVSGQITYLNVPEGRMVSSGTLIARINDADLQAQLGKSVAQLNLATETQNRLKKLLDISGINQADYDAAVNDVKSLEADIKYTKALIDKTEIRAPFSGVMGLRQVSIGAYVTSQTIIATLQQTSNLKIDFTMPEEDAKDLHRGSVVQVLLGTDVANSQAATIEAIEPQINTDTRNMIIRAKLSSNKINPGAFVKVYIQSGVDKNGIMIPTNAIIPDAKKKKVVLVKNGKAIFTDVETGLRREGFVEITKGVEKGDSVVVTGVLFARPGAAVTVRNVVDSVQTNEP
ncbi:MAG: efflux RND transporter periplasmic adaptor subunit [Chitinophagaceae bacterium]